MLPYFFWRSRAVSAKTLMNSPPMILRFFSGSVSPFALSRKRFSQSSAMRSLEDLLDHLAFVEAHAAVVDEDADELLADGLVEKRRADGRVNAAGKREQDLLVADLLLDRLDLLLDVLLRVEGLADAGKALFLCLVHVSSFMR